MTRIQIIGDSISLDYGRYLPWLVGPETVLLERDGVAEAYRNLDTAIGGNGGDSSRVLAKLEELERQGRMHFDLLVFNCGLHDIKRARPEETLQIPPEAYARNLRAILALAEKHDIRPVFVSTTPADETRYAPDAQFTRYAADAVQYNEIAAAVMQEHQVPVWDLYRFTTALGLTGDALYRDHTHFTDPVIRMQAAFLAGAMEAEVQK